MIIRLRRFVLFFILFFILMSLAYSENLIAQRSYQMIKPLPNDEMVVKGYIELTNIPNFDWWTDREYTRFNETDLTDKVLDAFSMYTYGINDGDDDLYDGEGDIYKADYPFLTAYNDEDEYHESKTIYYKYNYKNRVSDDDIPDAYYRKVRPIFNIEHYNKVAYFINDILEGDREAMRTADWSVIESAELLTLYRLYLMIDNETKKTGESVMEVILDKERSLDFFHALLNTPIIKEENEKHIMNGKEFNFSKTFGKKTLKDISTHIPSFKVNNKNDEYSPNLGLSFYQSKRNKLVRASLGGLYNKDPRIVITATHWLRRLGPSEVMVEDVKNRINEVLKDKVEFIDTNIFLRRDYLNIEDYPEIRNLFPDNVTRNEQARSIQYAVSQDFETFFYMPYGRDDYKETVTFYDMKPDYNPLNPYKDPELPPIRYSGAYPVNDEKLLYLMPIANPNYTEDRYEFFFNSYGMYQKKSPAEELEKLFAFIRREMIVDRIRSGKDADIFAKMSDEDFGFISEKIDDEYMLRIPMLSFFGQDPDDTLDLKTGDYNSEKAFEISKSKFNFIEEAYTRYPIFNEYHIQVIAQGVANENFIVQKGTAEYLTKFYNYYCNLDEDTKRDIKDSMYYYKSVDAVIEEVTLAFEAEQLKGRHIIKAGTKLGNELNPGGVRQYKNIPLELRRDVRRNINEKLKELRVLKYEPFE